MKKVFLILVLFVAPYAISSELEITRYHDGQLTATYTLSKTVDSLDFQMKAKAFRLASWKLKSPCLSFDGDSVKLNTGCEGISKIEFDISPSMYEENRRYPAVINFSDSKAVIVNLSYFKLNDEPLKVEIINEQPNSSVFFHNKFHGKHLTLDSSLVKDDSDYLFIGAIRSSNSSLITAIDSTTPKWIAENVEANSKRFVRFYERMLGIKLRQQHFLSVTFSPAAKGTFWRGDVDANGMISLRFYGSGWHDFNKASHRNLLRFISHESFHLFNSIEYKSADSVDNPWLHEGAADAAAILSMKSLDLITDKEFHEEISKQINDCKEFHDVAAAPVARTTNTKFVYGCGSLVNFDWDRANTNHRFSGFDSVFNTASFFYRWKVLLKNSTGHVYDKTGFLNSFGPNGVTYINQLLQGVPNNPVISALNMTSIRYTREESSVRCLP